MPDVTTGAVFHPEDICASPGDHFPRQWWTEPTRILTVVFEREFHRVLPTILNSAET